MIQDTLQSAARDTVAVAGHHFNGMVVAVVVVVIVLAVGFILWHGTRPVVVDDRKRL
jgi:anti-sigma-K factor RskA